MLTLPTLDGRLEAYALTGTPLTARPPRLPLTRAAFAAAHVASDPLAERDPSDGPPAVDWNATLGFRRHLWDQGLHLAEAMDAAQRGMGVAWQTALELIQRTLREAAAHPMALRAACGCGTDHAAPGSLPDAARIDAAHEHQAEAIEAAGGQLILARGVEAALCFNDLMALGLQAGGRMRIMGFGDVEKAAQARPPLGSAPCHVAGFGRLATETVLNGLERKIAPLAEQRLPVRLEARASSLAP